MNARVLSYTNVTPMPCVLTLRDGTSVAVLEDTREMVNFALVRNLVPQKTKVLLCHAIVMYVTFYVGWRDIKLHLKVIVKNHGRE